jgi:hypothetical protein
MINPPGWQVDFERELAQAQASRQAGNEGMARVCARRAAGIVVGEYLRRRESPSASPGPSAYDRLRYLASLPEISLQVREVAQYFLLRITTDRALPLEVDLIAEAAWLKEALLDTEPSS